MPPDIASASRHAVERYRLHYPAAQGRDLLAAVALSLPISQEIARALVGRALSTSGGTTDEYRLHPEGRGIFVLCPVAITPSQSFVRTYLRLDTYEQQRMAQAWFLEPVQLLRQSFELGFETARRDDAPALAMQASEAALVHLSALAPRLASPPAPAPAPIIAPARAATPSKTSSPPRASSPPTEEHHTVAGPAGLRLSISPRVQEILDWFAASHPSFMVELTRWQVLPPQSVALVQSFSHVPSMPVCGGLLEPGAQAVALLAAQGDTTEVLSLTNVPRKQRAALLDAVQSGVLLPPSAPTPTATPRAAAELVPRLAVSYWSQTARQEAEA